MPSEEFYSLEFEWFHKTVNHFFIRECFIFKIFMRLIALQKKYFTFILHIKGG